jgi:hypothetical protein
MASSFYFIWNVCNSFMSEIFTPYRFSSIFVEKIENTRTLRLHFFVTFFYSLSQSVLNHQSWTTCSKKIINLHWLKLGI